MKAEARNKFPRSALKNFLFYFFREKSVTKLPPVFVYPKKSKPIEMIGNSSFIVIA